VVDFVRCHEKYCPKSKMVVSSRKGHVNVELTKLAGGEELNSQYIAQHCKFSNSRYKLKQQKTLIKL
jgi:hypothetical protein